MATTSPRLGLIVPSTADQFSTEDLVNNWDRLEASPGVRIATVPAMGSISWGAAHTGMFLTQSDTGLTYRWNGAAFERAFARGWLAGGSATSDFTESAGALTTAVQAAGVAVPPGNRKVQIVVSWSEITGDAAEFQLTRDGTQIDAWVNKSGDGGTRVVTEVPGSGSFTYAVRFRTLGASSTIEAATDRPLRLDIVEV